MSFFVGTSGWSHNVGDQIVPHANNIIQMLHFPQEVIEELSIQTEDLRRRLFALVPHEIDDVSDNDNNMNEGGHNE